MSKRTPVSGVAVAMLGGILASCSMGPPVAITTPLKNDYRVEAVSIVFDPAGSLFVAGPQVPEGAPRPKLEDVARASIDKGVRHRFGEMMRGSRPARVEITVKTLNCPELSGGIRLVGGFSYLKAELQISNAATGAVILPKQGFVASDNTGFGAANIKTAQAAEPGGERNCTLLLGLQLAASVLGTNTAPVTNVYVP